MMTIVMSTIIAAVLSINTLSTQFERTVFEDSNKEITRGTIYYQSDSRTIVEIDFPIQQILIFNKHNLEIYYPEKKSALILNSDKSFPLIFLYNFLGSLKEDFGLSDIGYKLTSHELKNNTLYTYWALSTEGKKDKVDYVFTLGRKKNMMLFAESKDAEGKLISKIEFRNHIQLNNNFLPTEILSEYHTETDSTKERVTFSKIMINEKIPDRILNFKIPGDTKIEQIQM